EQRDRPPHPEVPGEAPGLTASDLIAFTLPFRRSDRAGPPPRRSVMTKLLFIQASPRCADSKSNQAAETYLATLRARNPALEVDTLDVWREDLPAFDGDNVAAKMNVIAGQGQNAAQKAAWDQIVEIASRFISADRYLIAAQMWNGGIPY